MSISFLFNYSWSANQKFISPSLIEVGLNEDPVLIGCPGIVITIIIIAMIILAMFNTIQRRVQSWQFRPKRSTKPRPPKPMELRAGRATDGNIIVWDVHAVSNRNALLTAVHTRRAGCLRLDSWNSYLLTSGVPVVGFIIDPTLARTGHGFYMSRRQLNSRYILLYIVDGGLSQCPTNVDDILITINVSYYA